MHTQRTGHKELHLNSAHLTVTENNLLRHSNLTGLLKKITFASNKAISLDEIFLLCIDEICQFTGWQIGHAYLFDHEKTHQLYSLKLWHLEDPGKYKKFKDLSESVSFQSGSGLPGTVLASCKPEWITNFDKMDKRKDPRVEIASLSGITSAFAFPVLTGEDTAAVLEFFSSDDFNPDEDLQECLYLIGLLLGHVVERSRSVKKSLYQKNIINQIHDAVIITDLDSRITRLNKGAEQLLGYRSNELIGKHIKLIYPKSKIKFKQLDIINILKKKGDFKFKTLMSTKTGHDFFTHTSLSPLYDNNEEIYGIISYTTNIDETERSQRVLNQANIVDQIHDAVITTNKDSIITSWNKGAERQFGYTAREIVGRPIYVLYPEIKHKYRMLDIINILKVKNSFEIETRMKKKSGEEFFAHNSISLLINQENEIDGIISYSLDITEHKKTEEELTRYRNRLEELVHERTAELNNTREILLRSNHSLKVLSQGNQALIHANDEQELLNEICRIITEVGNYRLAWVGYADNDKDKSIRPVAYSGYEEDYLKDLNLTWDNSKMGLGPAGTAIRTAKPHIARNTLTDTLFEPWRAEAVKRGYASVAGIPLIENKQVFGVLVIYAPEIDAFDEEEIKLLTQLANNITYGITAIRTSNELLKKEKLAVLGQLTATVSHELRNPLGTIRTSLYNISQKLHESDRKLLEKSINRAERNIVRCDNIIEELLDFTRKTDLVFEEILFDELCKEIVTEYDFPEFIKIETDLLAGIKVKIEKEKITRCVINIINNACQAIEQSLHTEKTKDYKITFTTKNTGKIALLVINDNGSGIPGQELQKIFEPLYSTKTYGVGLGLPIVKQIMKQHSGGIEITSEPEQGTSVKLWLPLINT